MGEGFRKLRETYVVGGKLLLVVVVVVVLRYESAGSVRNSEDFRKRT
jgi:hypothetical protein